MVITGGDTLVHYSMEDDFTGSTSGNQRNFGANETLQTVEATNNGTRITMPGSNITYTIKAGTFDGSWGVNFGLTNPWWAELVWGSPTTVDNSDGSYTHTFSGIDPQPAQIIEGYETSTTAERVLKGCVPATVTVDPSVEQDGYIPATLEGFYATEEVETGVTLDSQPEPTEPVLDYGDATLKRGGTAEAIVENATLNLALNTEPIPALGSRFPIDFIAGLFEPSIDFTKLKEDSDALQNVYGGSTSMQESVDDSGSLELAFDNGENPGSGINHLQFQGSGDFADSYGEANGGDPRSAIEENLSDMLQDVDLVATNEVSTAP